MRIKYLAASLSLAVVFLGCQVAAESPPAPTSTPTPTVTPTPSPTLTVLESIAPELALELADLRLAVEQLRACPNKSRSASETSASGTDGRSDYAGWIASLEVEASSRNLLEKAEAEFWFLDQWLERERPAPSQHIGEARESLDRLQDIKVQLYALCDPTR